MKRFIRTAMAVMLAVMAVACSNDEEQPLSECRGTVRVSIDGIINGYTTQDATRAVAQNVVRIMWEGGETVYVYEGATCLGSLTATKGDDKGTYATLSGTITAPTAGKTLTLVYSPQFSGEPTVSEDGKLSLDLSTQADKEVPFLIYATMPATEATAISGASVHFDLATSVYKCNVTGLVAEGSITKAVIGEVNTVCELTLSDDAAPTVSGTTPGTITRTAGFSAADQRAIFSVAVAKTGETAAGRTIEITKGDKKFSAAFDKGVLNIAAAYNTVCVLKEKQAPAGSTGAAMRTGSETPVNWVQLWEGGPKFAVYNVGAENNKAEDYGGYYAWGGNQDKVDDHYTGEGPLSGDNDTATKLWGSNWRMPTQAELQDLIDNCTVENVVDPSDDKKILGNKFTGKDAYSTNSIFLPAAGCCDDGNVFRQGGFGSYWSSTPDDEYTDYAYDLEFDSGYQCVYNHSHDHGYSVRAVLNETKGTAKATINSTEVDVNWVQLWAGGPKFAEYNVGVTDGKAESYGGYYTWGGTYNNNPALEGYSWTDDHNTTNDGTGDLTGTDDTATNLWGGNWRMPTADELGKWDDSESKYVDGLLGKCTVEWIDGTTKKYKDTDITGLLCTGKGAYASNSVFLPAAGYCYGGGVYGQGDCGNYWSSAPDGSNLAYYLYFDSGNQDVSNYYRYFGHSVRAVLAEKQPPAGSTEKLTAGGFDWSSPGSSTEPLTEGDFDWGSSTEKLTENDAQW